MRISNRKVWYCVATIFAILGLLLAETMQLKKEIKLRKRNKILSDKHFALFVLMNQWVCAKQKGKSIAEYLIRKEYYNVAIYGMSYVGNTLVEELKNTDVNVVYGIDQETNVIYTDVNVVCKDEITNDVDAIIVTAITCFNEIKDDLAKRTSATILSLEDILYEL